MDDAKKQLQGSRLRDIFKRAHKNLPRRFWATDLDFVLVDKIPPGIVAFFDYKHPSDMVTFSEVLAYNALIAIAPLFIVESQNPEVGPFRVQSYLGGDWHPEPPRVDLQFVRVCQTWAEFGEFERELRLRRKGGVGA